MLLLPTTLRLLLCGPFLLLLLGLGTLLLLGLLRLLLRLLCLLLLRWTRLRRRAHHLRPASALPMLLDKALNIALADSSAQAGAGDLVEINVVLTRHTAHQR